MKSWISLGMSSAQWLSLWLWSVPACSGRRWALPTATSGQDRAAFFISSHFNSFLLPRGGSERIDSSSYPRASLKHTLLCQFGPVGGAGCPIRHQRLRCFLLAVTCWPVVRSSSRRHAGVPGRPLCAHQGEAKERAAGPQRGAPERQPHEGRVRAAVSYEAGRPKHTPRGCSCGLVLQRRGAASARAAWHQPLLQ